MSEHVGGKGHERLQALLNKEESGTHSKDLPKQTADVLNCRSLSLLSKFTANALHPDADSTSGILTLQKHLPLLHLLIHVLAVLLAVEMLH